MNAIPKLAPGEGLTIDEFLAFTATRPQEERWELIEGMPVLKPSPIQIHQLVALNIAHDLMRQKELRKASWIALLGVGTAVPISPNSLPQPDVYVQEGAALDSHVTDDALLIFEVLRAPIGKPTGIGAAKSMRAFQIASITSRSR